MRALFASIILVAACGGPAKPPTTGTGTGNGATASASIRSVDWANRTYQTDAGPLTVKDGEVEYVVDPEMPDMPGWFQVGGPSYGDVDGDGVDEALLVTSFNGGGSGTFTQGEVYALRAGASEPIKIGDIPGGDRADGGLDDVRIENGKIFVARNQQGEDDAACCASKLVHEIWSWNGSKFVEDESARRVVDNPNFQD